MYCPKCGVEALEKGQRFCKACGTNLEAVNDALDRGENKTSLLGLKDGIIKAVKDNVDVDGLVKTVKESVGDMAINNHSRRQEIHARRAQRKLEKLQKWEAWQESIKAKSEAQRLPKPKEWLAYSWQHNLKHGLISLFSGAGLGFFFYYLGRVAIESGVVQQIEAEAGHSINGLDQAFRLIWLISIFTILKGLGQIIYAAFFAESIATLAERFTPQPVLTDSVAQSRNTAPQAFVSPTMDALQEPPASVTEGTTKFFEEAPVTKKQM